MNHIMLDLETLGIAPNAVFTSIGAVQFDINTGETGLQFYTTVDVQSQLNIGRTVLADTLEWRMQQNKDVRADMWKSSVPLEKALRDFTSFILDATFMLPKKGKLVIWGNSATFDIEKLGNAFDLLKLTRPWQYRDERCYRTLASEFKHLANVIENQMAHNPIADCEFQIRKLCAIWKRLKHNAHQNTQFEEDYTTSIFMLAELRDDLKVVGGADNEIRARKIQDFLDGVKNIK